MKTLALCGWADTVLAYQNLVEGTHGIVWKYIVNHSAVSPEFTRPVDIPVRVDAPETRPGTASTNLADSPWKAL